ncbi:UNKNOWN [Stylonychia lemnae]|uniref:Uncharacterized protein n=1 Tax=Stylonychia lemnae TaxID=5949 RepID=A0A078AUF7_STYLE|nr:UNKNOWN [Stylonychia lemnae]|eukprot:CDW84498.1 UNKNOWN [Stylonychia lemnae]
MHQLVLDLMMRLWFQGRMNQNGHARKTWDINGNQIQKQKRKNSLSRKISCGIIQISMGARYKTLDQKLKDGIPGPGEYQNANDTNKSIPSMKFGTSSRLSLEINKNIPGPGDYVGNFENISRAAPKFGFGSGQRDDSLGKLKKFIPGPGQYEPPEIIGKEGQSKSMGIKPTIDLQEKELKSKPGPGQYDPNPDAMLKNSPNLKIGTAKRDDLAFKKQEYKPSPNNYNPNDSFSRTQSAAWGFGSSNRPLIADKRKQEFPGPNQYEIPSRVVEGPKFIMGQRTKDPLADKDNIPGPGKYDTVNKSTSKIKNEPSFSIGTGSRADIANLKQKGPIPGPGNYQSLDESFLKKTAPAYGFGSSKREESNEKSKTNILGPGAYDSRSFIGNEGRQNSISPKLDQGFKLRESRNLPGPGSYDQNQSAQILKNSPSFKIGTSKRSDSVIKERMSKPDPTAYSPNDSYTKQTSAKFGFGTGKRKSIADDHIKLPGPGQYALASKAFETQSRFAMGIKVKELSKFSVPGPGEYDNNSSIVKKNMPSFSISGKTSELKKLDVPGPGEYTIKEKTIDGPKFSIGTSQRVALKKTEVPGPGAYKLPSTIANLPTHALPNQKEEFKFV